MVGYLGFVAAEPALAHARKAGLANIYGLWEDRINSTMRANSSLTIVCPLFYC